MKLYVSFYLSKWKQITVKSVSQYKPWLIWNMFEKNFYELILFITRLLNTKRHNNITWLEVNGFASVWVDWCAYRKYKLKLNVKCIFSYEWLDEYAAEAFRHHLTFESIVFKLFNKQSLLDDRNYRLYR